MPIIAGKDLATEEWLRIHDEWVREPPACQQDQQVAFLQERGPDPALWYHTVRSWQWCADPAVLKWMAAQPEFDGSAASMMLMAFGGEWRDREEAGRMGEMFDALQICAERWRAGTLPVRFGFDANVARSFEEARRQFLERRSRIGNPPVWDLPAAAFGPFPGPTPRPPTDVGWDGAGDFKQPLEAWFRARYL